MGIVLSCPRRRKESEDCEFEKQARELSVLHTLSDVTAEKAALAAEAQPHCVLSSLPSRMDHFNFEDEFLKNNITYVCTTGPRKQSSTRMTGRPVGCRRQDLGDDCSNARDIRNRECQMQAWHAYLRGIDGYWRQKQAVEISIENDD